MKLFKISSEGILTILKDGKYEISTNRAFENRIFRKKKLRCALCRPNKGENKKQHRKHGTRKPKHKNKRK